jgi:hypothetical protein
MATSDYEPEGEQDHISKLAFTAVAAPDPGLSSGETGPYEIRDLDQYVAKGAPATTKEVISYYAYVRLIPVRFATVPPESSAKVMS